MDGTHELLSSLFRKNFGTSSVIDERMVFLNKIPGDDRTDEVIAHGAVIAVLRYSLQNKEHNVELRQAGAEILSQDAEKNVITLGSVSGHLKGKNVSGSEITNIKGDFKAGDPLIIRKGGKVGHGIALVNSEKIKEAEKAVKIRDLSVPSDIPLSPPSGRKEFTDANASYFKDIEAAAANDVKSFVRARNEKVTVSFSGGKDSLATLGVTMKVSYS
jgi:phosphoadenosine phosphosulfate reductase